MQGKMTKGKPQTTKNNTAQENLTERLERKETVRGTALTITGGATAAISSGDTNIM